MKRSRRSLLVILVVSVTVLLLAAWWFLPGRRAEVRLPPFATTEVPRTAFAEEPIYLQEDSEYLMMDPLGDGKSLAPLSSLGSDILAVRVVTKADK